jgi:hypothetical protein
VGRSECEAPGDAGRLIEIPARHGRPAEAFGVAAETRVFLGERSIDLAEEEQTKTRRLSSSSPMNVLAHGTGSPARHKVAWSIIRALPVDGIEMVEVERRIDE